MAYDEHLSSYDPECQNVHRNTDFFAMPIWSKSVYMRSVLIALFSCVSELAEKNCIAVCRLLYCIVVEFVLFCIDRLGFLLSNRRRKQPNQDFGLLLCLVHMYMYYACSQFRTFCTYCILLIKVHVAWSGC